MIANILTIIAGLIALLLLIAAFVPRNYRIERSILIRRNRQDVFNYIRFLKNQDHYSKWAMSDPDKRTEFRGTDGTVGFVYAWDSQNKQAGKGEQEIVRLDEDNHVDSEIRFEKPFENVGYTRMTTESVVDDDTRLIWSMEGRNKYPLNLMNLFIPKLLGSDMEISLNNLKNILEKERAGQS